jgi:hypothetical protein
VTDYSYALDLLDDYDHQRIPSFVDGNKRIAAALFLWFMEKNGLLYAAQGEKRIADTALVAITLMIAESASREKDSIIRIVMHLIGKRK